MRLALLIVDLEGVAGVDDVADLVAGSASYPHACELLAAEIAAAVRGLRAAGFDRVRISDSHRAGGDHPNVRGLAGAAGVEINTNIDVDVMYTDDAYCADAFEGAAAVACLGMHAAAGTAGFAAHTVDPLARWRVADRDVSETDIVCALAAAREIPVVFVTGDDVLEAHTRGPAYVCSKRAVDARRARSREPAEVIADIERAAAAGPVVTAGLSGPLTLEFRSRWQARVAQSAGAERVDPRTVRVDGDDFASSYDRARGVLAVVAAPIEQAIRRTSPRTVVDDCTELLCRPFPDTAATADTALAARRAVTSFLAATDGDASWQRADRALALHMLSHHAPGVFASAQLAPVLDAATDALVAVPATFGPGVTAAEAMARLDAAYVRLERTGSRPDIDARALSRYLGALARDDALAAWLLSELAVQLGLPRAVTLPPRWFRRQSRVHDLYWLTHLCLLETRYLARPLPTTGWESAIEELLLATRWTIHGEQIDLAAELAICLQLAGERDTAEHRAIVDALLAHQHDDGTVNDPSTTPGVEDRARSATHVTGAAMIVFAGNAAV